MVAHCFYVGFKCLYDCFILLAQALLGQFGRVLVINHLPEWGAFDKLPFQHLLDSYQLRRPPNR